MYEIIREKLYLRIGIPKLPLEEKIKSLQSKNITMIADFNHVRDEDLFAKEPYFYRHFPVEDLSEQTKDTLSEYSKLFAKQLKISNKAALVECRKAEGQPVLFVALIVMQYQHMTLDDAMKYVETICINVVDKLMEDLDETVYK